MTFRVPKDIQQPAWRVWVLHYAAKALGVLAHVEGMPIGSNRIYPRRYAHLFGDHGGISAQAMGSRVATPEGNGG